ncbi:DUF6883 domain-containing protein [Calothrix sp. PCC 7507]|uniref:DUF6883 domain-containing protein n=1 Tax=Calothrix sp. PCC 7507 TaxID=99598 RepID=UPI00350EFDD3
MAGYCLNPEHPEGKHKARVFKSALNLDLNDAEELQTILLQAVANYDQSLVKVIHTVKNISPIFSLLVPTNKP